MGLLQQAAPFIKLRSVMLCTNYAMLRRDAAAEPSETLRWGPRLEHLKVNQSSLQRFF